MKRIILSFLVVAVGVASCRKEPVANTPFNSPNNKMAVLLSDYLTVDNVDSAFVNWSLNGVSHRARLQANGHDLSASTAGFEPGNGRLTIRVFSKNMLAGHALQYERVLDLAFQKNAVITVTGPNLFEDANWNPRVIFNHREQYAIMKVTAVVGIRPNDPYFELIDVNPAWRSRIIIQREYYHRDNLTTPVASGTWDCQDNCTDASGNYVNTNFFSFIPQLINNRPWNRVLFFARFYNTPMSAGELHFDYNF